VTYDIRPPASTYRPHEDIAASRCVREGHHLREVESEAVGIGGIQEGADQRASSGRARRHEAVKPGQLEPAGSQGPLGAPIGSDARDTKSTYATEQTVHHTKQNATDVSRDRGRAVAAERRPVDDRFAGLASVLVPPR
jgi:hypothetical protein